MSWEWIEKVSYQEELVIARDKLRVLETSCVTEQHQAGQKLNSMRRLVAKGS